MKPDEVTFVGLLAACSHAGLVKEGWQFFDSIKSDYNLEVAVWLISLVDVRVEGAELLINKASFQSKSHLWKILLGAGNKYGNIEVGNWIAQMLVELEPNHNSTCVLLSNQCFIFDVEYVQGDTKQNES